MSKVYPVISAFTAANITEKKTKKKGLKNIQLLISPLQRKRAWKSSHRRKKKLSIFWVVQENKSINIMNNKIINLRVIRIGFKIKFTHAGKCFLW